MTINNNIEDIKNKIKLAPRKATVYDSALDLLFSDLDILTKELEQLKLLNLGNSNVKTMVEELNKNIKDKSIIKKLVPYVINKIICYSDKITVSLNNGSEFSLPIICGKIDGKSFNVKTFPKRLWDLTEITKYEEGGKTEINTRLFISLKDITTNGIKDMIYNSKKLRIEIE